MQRNHSLYVLALLSFVSLPTIGRSLAESSGVKVATALDAYVKAADAAFSYKVEKTVKSATHTSYIVRMQSQKWLTKDQVNRTTWEHDLTVIVPAKVASSVSLLMIGGGANGKAIPDHADKRLVQIALATKSVVTELKHVPNQPLVFADDPKKEPKAEDEIIAFSWRKYLEGGDVSWLAQLPMTKSAVRAMDVVTKVCKENASLDVNQFVVTGGSKRGWTTWLTAAVDKRVKAIVPLVIDTLNVRPAFNNHYQAYGFFAPAVEDYVLEGIMDWQNTKRYADLLKVVEPYEYRDRFKMPKLLINAGSDQFFTPDSSQFYFKDLPGEKYLRYVPNAGHSLNGSDAFETLLAYYVLILTDKARPKFTWEFTDVSTIVVKPEDRPESVKLWQVSNVEARDFRLETVGQTWESSALTASADGSYKASVDTPDKGWTAFMVELTYETPMGGALKLTTAARVTPDRLPFPPYEPKRK